jgi:four helix bundle protein
MIKMRNFLGSSFELETQLTIANQIGYYEDEAFEKLLSRLNILQKRINSFRNSL